MYTIEGTPIPRTIIEQYNRDYPQKYNGTLEQYTTVRYMAFRTKWAMMADREAPSLRAWLKMIADVDEANDARNNTQAKQQNNLK